MLNIRPITPEDEPLVSKWLEEDEIHRAIGIKWQDVIAPGTVANVVTDEHGVILTVVRYHLALRAAMQFNPEASYRIAKHGNELREMLRKSAEFVGAIEIIIRPGGDAVRFTEKLGFADFSGKYIGV